MSQLSAHPNEEEIVKEYKELCELHTDVCELAKKYYAALYLERKLLSKIKSKWHPGQSYKEFSSRCRRLARKKMGREKGKHRGAIDHRLPILLGFLLGLTIDEINSDSNLKIISKDANRRKSYLFDFDAIEET